MVVAQIYVKDIVFGGMSQVPVKHFVQQIQSEFEMCMVGELNYFLGFKSNNWKIVFFSLKASMPRIL